MWMTTQTVAGSPAGSPARISRNGQMAPADPPMTTNGGGTLCSLT